MSTDEFMARHIVVSGLPKNITPEKRDTFLRHFNKKVTEVLGHGAFNVHLVTDESTGLVSGAFLAFSKVGNAEDALARLNLYHFTKADVLLTHRWAALGEASKEVTEYEPPKVDTEAAADFAHTMAMDQAARPQFIVKGGMTYDTEWYWFNWDTCLPELVRRPNALKTDSMGQWTEMDRRLKMLQGGIIAGTIAAPRPLPTWSTYGTFVVSQHSDGLKVWGGKSMNLLFLIPGVDISAFLISATEKYIVVKTDNDISIWNIHTARRIRTLGGLDLNSDDRWPITRFSADDSLIAVTKAGNSFAEMGKLYIYHADTMRVVQGFKGLPASHTFEVKGLHKAEWNPKVGTQMAITADMGNNTGWNVTIQDITIVDNIAHEERLIQRSYAKALKVDLLWHSAGTHLAVKQLTKTGTEYSLFEVGERGVGVHQLQVDPGFSANRFAWQPTGGFFAVILDKTNADKTLGVTSELRIYVLKKKIKLITKFPSSATNLLWSPQGNRLVCVNYEKSMLEFIGVNDNDTVTVLKKISAVIGGSQWDPSGRFFATWVSSLRTSGAAVAPQYRIYDLNGLELFQKEWKNLSHFVWRPLPPSVLSPEEIKAVRDAMPKHVEQYYAEKAALQQKEEEALAVETRQMEDKYQKKMKSIVHRAEHDDLARIRADLIASSPWARYWQRRIKALPESDRIVHETVVEERIDHRRVLHV